MAWDPYNMFVIRREGTAMQITDDNGLYAELGIDLGAQPDYADAQTDEHDYQALLLKLVDMRLTLGISQEAVAQFMKTHQSAISRMESGLSDARYSTLQRYARSLGAQLESTISCDRPQWLEHLRLSGLHWGVPKASPSATLRVEVERTQA